MQAMEKIVLNSFKLSKKFAKRWMQSELDVVKVQLCVIVYIEVMNDLTKII